MSTVSSTSTSLESSLSPVESTELSMSLMSSYFSWLLSADVCLSVLMWSDVSFSLAAMLLSTDSLSLVSVVLNPSACSKDSAFLSSLAAVDCALDFRS